MDWRALSLVLGSILVIGAGTALAVPNAQLTVSDVSVDPGEPTAGEPFTLTPTIQNSAGSDEAATVDSVVVEIDGEQVAKRTNIGALSPGDSLDVPVTTSIDEPGQHDVTITVVGTDESGEEVTVSWEETVVVSEVPQVRLTVDDPAIEPETPATGAPVTVPTTISSSGSSTQPFDVDAVVLRNESSTLARAADIGAVSAGESISVPLTTTFQTSGEHSLTIALEGTNANDQPVTVSQPVTVVVEAGDPLLEFQNPAAVENVPAPVTINVSNPTETALRNIVTTVSGTGIEGEIDRRVIPTLAAGGNTQLSFLVRAQRAGDALLQTNVSYTTAAGTTAITRATTVLPVEPLDESVSVRVRPISGEQPDDSGDLGVDVGGIIGGGGGTGVGDGTADEQETDGEIRVLVSNLGNAAIERVVLAPRAGNRSLGPRPVTDRLEPGAEASVALSLDRTPPSEIVFEARYEIAGNESTATTTFDPVSSQGSVTVTGVDLEFDGEQAVITGDLGNPGNGDVSGVVVSVGNNSAVAPAYPNRDFFVGQIESNGFAPFELTATVGENATAVPLEVEYFVAGDRRTETLQFPVEDRPSNDGSPFPSPFLVGGILLVLSALVALSLIYIRRS